MLKVSHDDLGYLFTVDFNASQYKLMYQNLKFQGFKAILLDQLPS